MHHDTLLTPEVKTSLEVEVNSFDGHFRTGHGFDSVTVHGPPIFNLLRRCSLCTFRLNVLLYFLQLARLETVGEVTAALFLLAGQMNE